MQMPIINTVNKLPNIYAKVYKNLLITNEIIIDIDKPIDKETNTFVMKSEKVVVVANF